MQVKQISQAAKQIEKYFAEPVKQAHAMHKLLTTRRGEALQPYEEAIGARKSLLADWMVAEQARVARERQEAEAREKIERNSLQKQVDEDAAWIEYAVREEAARQQAALAQVQAQAEAQGDEEAAQMAETMAVEVAAQAEAAIAAPVAEIMFASLPVVLPPAPIAGMGTFRTDYDVEVIDLLALAALVAMGEAPLEWIEVNLSPIKKAVKDAKGNLAIPGVRITSKQVPVIGR
jgi:hypothetical protein